MALIELEVEPTTGIEPVTPSLPRKCSTPEPRGLLTSPNERPASQSATRHDIETQAAAFHNSHSKTGAGDGTRTRDPQLGRLMLYQLSYSRSRLFLPNNKPAMVERGGFEPPKA